MKICCRFRDVKEGTVGRLCTVSFQPYDDLARAKLEIETNIIGFLEICGGEGE